MKRFETKKIKQHQLVSYSYYLIGQHTAVQFDTEVDCFFVETENSKLTFIRKFNGELYCTDFYDLVESYYPQIFRGFGNNIDFTVTDIIVPSEEECNDILKRYSAYR